MTRLLPSVILVSVALGCGPGATQTTGDQGAATATRASNSTTTEPTVTNEHVRADLIYLREEEKLARDVYVHLYARWNIEAFHRISESEQRHMDRVGVLLSSRGIEDPVRDDTTGVFTNPELGGLYTALTEAGDASELAALRVGAQIEDLDIRDIRRMLSRAEGEDIIQTYRLLLCGSHNHMRAFSGLMQERGETYAAQYITPEHYQEILAEEHQRCGRLYGGGMHGGGGGRGMRGGGGRGMRGGGGRGMRGGQSQ